MSNAFLSAVYLRSVVGNTEQGVLLRFRINSTLSLCLQVVLYASGLAKPA